MKTIPAILLPLILVHLLFPLSALAHKVLVFAWVEDNRVHVEAGFGSDRPAKNSEIKALSPDRSLLLEGKTDDEGKWSFQVPGAYSQDMILELTAGPGHKGEWTIRADEFKESSSDAEPPQASARQKELKEGAHPLKILAGISCIFILAFIIRRFKKGSHD